MKSVCMCNRKARSWPGPAALCTMLLLQITAVAQAAETRVMRLATLEWVPYVSQQLPKQGLLGHVSALAAQKMGYQLKLDYFPWKRAMQLGGRDPNYAGYFPAYYTRERAQECHFSQSMGTSRIVLAYMKNKPLQWETVEDLALLKQPVGVVYGYANGEQFDDLVKQGRIKPETSTSDALNLRKLTIGRISAAVVDESVLTYLLKMDPGLAGQVGQIMVHPQALAELKLYICFQGTSQGLEMKTAFDQALQEINLGKTEEEYFQKLPALGK